MFCHDNLGVMQGMDSESVDLIYLDPPFNKKKKFVAPIGSSAEGAEFLDIFREEDIKDEWVQTIKEDYDEMYNFLIGIKNIGNKYNYCYLCYMAIRMIECQRVLKKYGSLYFHCDQTMSHYIKILLDCIFGEKNFINEIIWNYGTPSGGRAGGRKPVKTHDTLLSYAVNYGTHVYNRQYTPYSSEYMLEWFCHEDEDGRKYRTRKIKDKIIKQYLDESKGVPLSSTWTDIKQLYGQKGWFPKAKEKDESVGYPTQKPLALLERVIQSSSNKGDLVLDPFCGCATTCVAAERLERQWIGIDVSYKAFELVNERIEKEVSEDLFRGKANYTTTPPKRTDTGEGYLLKKYVYIISHKNYKGEYKVGIAKNWQLRLSAYQTSDPGRNYKIEYKKLTHKFRETETIIHDIFPNRHEWVRADLSEIIKKIEEVSA